MTKRQKCLRKGIILDKVSINPEIQTPEDFYKIQMHRSILKEMTSNIGGWIQGMKMTKNDPCFETSISEKDILKSVKYEQNVHVSLNGPWLYTGAYKSLIDLRQAVAYCK